MSNNSRISSDIDRRFGKVLTRLRKAKGLSQETLGFEADLDRSHISLLERGLRSPTLNTLLSLSRALDTSFSQLAQMIEAELETTDED